jgi:hypothetical protein
MSKKFDLAVKVGTHKDGKGKWKNIGVMMEGNNGPYILLDRTFNPAGVTTDKDMLMVSCFTPKDKSPGAALGFNDNDEIPF